MFEVKSLCKDYNGYRALIDLNWTIQENGVYGFLGPNGAGKSTTMNIITGCLSPSGGEVLIDGYSILENALEAKRKIGFLPEIPPLYVDMTPLEYLEFVAGIKGVAKGKRKKTVEKAMEWCSLLDVKNRIIKVLSKGYRQRVGIAQAILGDPTLIVLDEPTVGLDPVQNSEIRQMIRRLGEDHIVLLSSHILPEIQAISKRVLILQKGRVVAEGIPDEMERRLGGKRMIFTVKGEWQTVEGILREGDWAASPIISPSPGCCAFSVATDAAEETAEKMFFFFAEARLPIIRVDYPKTSLEDVFLELTDEKGEDS